MAFRTGDLRSTGTVMSPKRAQQGSEGHRKIQAVRPESYLREVPIEWTLEKENAVLTIQGRIDGLFPRESGWRVEEIKTTWSTWDRSPSPNHWAQVKLYGFFLCERDGLEEIELQLTYLELDTDQITVFRDNFSHEDLRQFVVPGLEYALGRWVQRERWIEERNKSLLQVEFPFPDYRPGQRPMAVAVYRNLRDRGSLCIEAPTGIGKTISTLFPAIKLMGQGSCQSICFLTAKNTGKALANESLDRIRSAGAKISSVQWTSRLRICFCAEDRGIADKITDVCPYTVGYYDRIRPALDEALTMERLGAEEAIEIARRHQICPHALIMEASRWFDVRIGDYNYRFDPHVAPIEGGSEFCDEIWLIDEAHHFPDRAREMYSAEIKISEIRLLREVLEREKGLEEQLALISQVEKELEKLTWDGWDHSETVRVREGMRGSASRDYPALLVKYLGQFNKTFEDRWTEQLESDRLQAAMDLFFSTWSMERCVDRWSENYAAILETGDLDSTQSEIRLRLACLDPSELIKERIESAAGVVLFSGTLGAPDRFKDQIGTNGASMKLPSPFPQKNFMALEAPYVSTVYSQRKNSSSQIVQSIYSAISPKTGHYWVFFSSFEYLDQIHNEFTRSFPEICVHRQSQDFNDEQRRAFVDRFRLEPGKSATKTQVGMVTLGGVFGEGVDLPGESLVGAVVVGVGLPMIEVERQLIRSLLDRKGEDGFEKAYIQPGMQRVLQAAGRVIRSVSDQGFVVLLDSRYRQFSYKQFLPDYWTKVRVENADSLQAAVRDFWNSADSESGNKD